MITVTLRRKGSNSAMKVTKMASALQRAVDVTAELVVNKAKHLIESPPKTGRIYGAESTVKFTSTRVLKGGVVQVKDVEFTANKGKKGHQASAPGEAPATLTGALTNSIRSESVKPLSKQVAAHTKYAYRLQELMDRPYLNTAMREQERPFMDRCKQAVKDTLESG